MIPEHDEVTEDAKGRHYLVRPAKKHWFSEDYRNPVPRNAPDFARVTDTSPISFPNNQFKTSMWPCERCAKPDDMVKFLSRVPLIGRKIECLRTYGPCAFVDERFILTETTGNDADYEDEEDVGKAYRQIPEGAPFGQRAVARYVVSIQFSHDGSFEIDGDSKPGSLYLAMNQIRCCLVAEFADREKSVSLLRDIRAWSQALPETAVSILVDNIRGERQR